MLSGDDVVKITKQNMAWTQSRISSKGKKGVNEDEQEGETKWRDELLI